MTKSKSPLLDEKDIVTALQHVHIRAFHCPFRQDKEHGKDLGEDLEEV